MDGKKVVKKIDSGELMEMELPREQVRLRHSLPSYLRAHRLERRKKNPSNRVINHAVGPMAHSHRVVDVKRQTGA